MRVVEQSPIEELKLDFSGFVFPDFRLPERFHFPKPAVFQGATFTKTGQFPRTKFIGDADFRGAEFMGNAYFRRAIVGGLANFGGARFRGAANFSKAKLEKGAHFAEATFEGTVQFPGATFGAGCFFRGRVFEGSANFGRATFSGAQAEFRDAIFKKNANFVGAIFDKDAIFSGARFELDSGFVDATFRGLASFIEVAVGIHGRLFFEECEFLSDAVFQDLKFDLDGQQSEPVSSVSPGPQAEAHLPSDDDDDNEVNEMLPLMALRGESASGFPQPDIRIDFRGVPIRERTRIRFQGVHSETSLDMSKVLLAHTDVSSLHFQNVSWVGPPAWVHLRRRDWPDTSDWPRPLTRFQPQALRHIVRVADEHVVMPLPGYRTTNPPGSSEALDPSLVGAIYKGLRANYEATLRYAEAGAFHVREMEMRRLSHGQAAKRRVTAWSRRSLSLLNAYRIVSNYGENYRRTFAWVGLTIGLFAAWFLYHPPPVGPGEMTSGQRELTLGNALVLSLQSFVPSFQTVGPSAAITMERILGLMLLALLTLALNRHFKR